MAKRQVKETVDGRLWTCGVSEPRIVDFGFRISDLFLCSPSRRGAASFFLAASRFRRVFASLLCLVSLIVSCRGLGPSLKPYEPVVVFTGMINGTRDTLPGHRGFPNACYLDNDTVKIIVCSDDYSPAGVSEGSLIRMYIYPFRQDSPAVATDPQSIVSIQEALLHMVTHTNDRTCTYDITPAHGTNALYGLEISIGNFRRRAGSPIELHEIAAVAPPLRGTRSQCAENLMLVDGNLKGRITR